MHDLSDIFIRPIAEAIGRVCTEWTANWIAKDQSEPLQAENGRSVAKYGHRAIIVGSAGVCVFFALSLGMLFGAQSREKWIALPFGFFALFSAHCLFECAYTRFEFNRDELFVRTLWHGRLLPCLSVFNFQCFLCGLCGLCG